MMKFIFNENSDIGIYPIKYFHIVWYDKDNECFDEDFIEPEKFNHGELTYAFVDDERNSDEEYSRVFAVTIDGKEYELKFERRNKNGMGYID